MASREHSHGLKHREIFRPKPRRTRLCCLAGGVLHRVSHSRRTQVEGRECERNTAAMEIRGRPPLQSLGCVLRLWRQFLSPGVRRATAILPGRPNYFTFSAADGEPVKQGYAPRLFRVSKTWARELQFV